MLQPFPAQGGEFKLQSTAAQQHFPTPLHSAANWLQSNPLPSTSLPASFPPQTTRRHKHAKNNQPQSSTQPARGRTTQGGLCGCNEHKSGRSLTPDQAWGAHHARSFACHGFFTLSFSRHLLKSCMKHAVGTKRTNTV